jgi:hypothetical protein
MKELKDTVDLMLSSDYKDRFKAEYQQLLIRTTKLENMIKNWSNLSFTPTCPKVILIHQLLFMKDYLGTLKRRAQIEKIDLEEVAETESQDSQENQN